MHVLPFIKDWLWARLHNYLRNFVFTSRLKLRGIPHSACSSTLLEFTLQMTEPSLEKALFPLGTLPTHLSDSLIWTVPHELNNITQPMGSN